METPEGEVTLRAGADEYLLDAIRRAGIAAPATCLQGWCLTCAARLLAGEVDSSESLRYYPEDREAGFVLPCSARPRSDLRLRLGAKEAMQAHRIARGLPAPRG